MQQQRHQLLKLQHKKPCEMTHMHGSTHAAYVARATGVKQQGRASCDLPLGDLFTLCALVVSVLTIKPCLLFRVCSCSRQLGCGHQVRSP